MFTCAGGNTAESSLLFKVAVAADALCEALSHLNSTAGAGGRVCSVQEEEAAGI